MRAVEQPPWGRFDNLEALAAAPLQEGRFSAWLDGGRFECFLKLQPGDRLWVLLSGARDPAARSLPKFDRWTWAPRYPGPVLCISDPTLYLGDETLRIGWYVGTDTQDWQAALAALVRTVAAQLGLATREVIAYGSSAGGFGALMLASHLGDATAIAINPQTEVLRYSKRLVRPFLEASFGGRSGDALRPAERQRLSVLHAVGNAPMVRCLVAQNEDDAFHFDEHYTPFCEAFHIPVHGGADPGGRLHSRLFRDSRGHVGEPVELADELIVQGLELSQAQLDPLALRAAALTLDWTRQPGRIRAAQIDLASAPAPSLQLPIDWGPGSGQQRGDAIRLQQWRMLDSSLLAFDRSGDAGDLEGVEALITDWAEWSAASTGPARDASIWNEAATARRSMKLAFLVSAHRAGAARFDAGARWRLDRLAAAHLAVLLGEAEGSQAAHHPTGIQALAALRQVGSGDAIRRIDRHLAAALPDWLSTVFDADGVHRENSPGRHENATATLRAWQAWDWFAEPDIDRMLTKASQAEDLFRMPNGLCVPIGDTLARPAAADVPEPHTRFSARAQLALRSGYAVYRDDGEGLQDRASYLMLMGAFQSLTHKHADDLSVVWFDGEDILCDAGRTRHPDKAMRAYVRSAAAHNAVEIEGGDATPAAPYGSALRDAVVSDWGIRISAARDDPGSGVRHVRHCLYAPHRWLLLIDRLRGPEPRRFTQWLHLAPHLELRLDELGVGVCALKSGAELAIRSVASAALDTVSARGRMAPEPQGWLAQGHAGMIPAWALGRRLCAHEATIATLLTIDDRGSLLALQGDGALTMQLAPADDGTRFELRWDDERCDAIVRPRPGGA